MNPLSLYPEIVELFRGFTAEELGRMSLVELVPGSILITENTFGDSSLFLILNGVCIGEKLNHKDDNFFAAYKVQRHEFIGLQELISPVPVKREITIRAKTAVTALKINASDFTSWQFCHPTIYNTIIYRVLTLQFQIRDLLINCVLKDSFVAGVYYLCYLYRVYLRSCYPDGYMGAVKLWDTRQEISLSLARDVRSVERVISSLRASDYLSTCKGKIHIDSKQYSRLLNLLENN